MRPPSYEQVLRRLANGVRAARRDLGLSQEEAAHRAGIAVWQWQRVESGRGITLKTLVAVAAALEVELEKIVRR